MPPDNLVSALAEKLEAEHPRLRRRLETELLVEQEPQSLVALVDRLANPQLPLRLERESPESLIEKLEFDTTLGDLEPSSGIPGA